MKKAICSALAALLALSALAGCGGRPAEDPAASAASGKSEPGGSVSAAYQGELPLAPAKTTIRFATHQGFNASIAPPSNDLPVYQKLEELTNVHIEWETVPVDSYAQVMSTRFASGSELPDVINLSNLGSYQQLAKDGVILPQNGLIDEYAYYMNQYMAQNPAYRKMITAPDGNIYGLESTTLESNLTTNLMVNTYAMERAGITEIPDTLDGFYDMLTAMRDSDINGNGVKDEIPLAANFNGLFTENIAPIAGAFGLEIGWDWNKYFTVRDGGLVSNFSLPEYREFIAFLNKLYAGDLVCKDFASLSYDKTIEYVSNGQCGVVGFWSTYAYLFGDASPDSEQFGEGEGERHPVFVPMDPLKTSSGDQFFIKRSGTGGDTMGISADCKEELRPLAMKWIDWLLASPQSLEIQTNGVEGLSYQKNADGSIEKITPEGKQWGSYVTELGGNQPPRAHMQLLDAWRNSWLPEWLDEVDASQQKFFRDGALLPLQFTEEEQKTADQIRPDLDVYLEENLVAFILGTKSLEEWDAFVSGLAGMRIDELKEVYASRYARQITE